MDGKDQDCVCGGELIAMNMTLGGGIVGQVMVCKKCLIIYPDKQAPPPPEPDVIHTIWGDV